MDDLLALVRAHIDDDEQTARATLWDGSGNTPDWHLPASATVDTGGAEFYAVDQTVARHIERHDPARVLRDVAAKRWIIDQAEQAWNRSPRSAKALAWRELLQLIAEAYADPQTEGASPHNGNAAAAREV